MLRIFILLFAITGISLAFVWVADEPGRVVVDWSNYHIETSVLVIAAGLALSGLLLVLVYSLLFTLVRMPYALARSRLARRQSLGLTALTETFAAIATQDVNTARRQLGRAQHYLPHQPLTLMLAAQLSRLEGNEGQARLHLEQMLTSEGAEFMALRGLIENSRRGHNDAAALEYAEKALKIKPQDAWLILTLAGLYTQAQRWDEALYLLEQSRRKRYIDKLEARRLSGAVLYEQARAKITVRQWDEAAPVLEACLKKLPGFIPAATLLARACVKRSEIRKALSVIENAWKYEPHPSLTESLLLCYDADRDRKKVVAVIQKLAQKNPEHVESQFLLAGLALHQGDNETARRLLDRILRDDESARACRMMADIEHESGDKDRALRWQKRANAANAQAAYICTSCKSSSDEWMFVCLQCGSAATLEWK